MKTLDMTPTLATVNVRDRRLGNPKVGGEGTLALASLSGLNYSDINLLEFGGSALFSAEPWRGDEQPQFYGMVRVSDVRNPFQVVRSVVTLDRILVIDLMPWRTGAKESLGNQSVNLPVMPMVFTGKIKAKVARRVNLGLQDKADVGTPTLTHPADTSKVGHVIPAFVADDGSPFFGFLGQSLCARLRVHRESPFSVPCSRRSIMPRGCSYYTRKTGI